MRFSGSANAWLPPAPGWPNANRDDPKSARLFFPSGEIGSRMKPAENAVSVSSTRSSPCASVVVIQPSVAGWKYVRPSSAPPQASMA